MTSPDIIGREERGRTPIGAEAPLGGCVTVEGVDETMENVTDNLAFYDRVDIDPERIIVTEAGILTGDESVTWTGSISLSERTELGADDYVDIEAVDKALNPKNLVGYFVKAYKNLRTRCVDGRCIEGYDKSDEVQDYGPQAAGGTPGAAVGFAIARGPDSGTYSGSTFDNDMESFADEIETLGFVLGGHEDDHHEEGKTGCGAIDKMPEIIKNMTDPSNVTRINELTQAVMGDMYDQGIFSEMLGNALLLQASSDNYFDGYKESLFSRMKVRAKSAVNPIVKLIGGHKEVAAIVNRVHGTTFDRDAFSSDNKHEIQAFNYDFWRTVELAETMMRDSPHYESMNQQEKIVQAKKFITARVMYTVSTLATLTDGSLRLTVLDEQDPADPEAVVGLFENFGNRASSTPTQIAA